MKFNLLLVSGIIAICAVNSVSAYVCFWGGDEECQKICQNKKAKCVFPDMWALFKPIQCNCSVGVEPQTGDGVTAQEIDTTSTTETSATDDSNENESNDDKENAETPEDTFLNDDADETEETSDNENGSNNDGDETDANKNKGNDDEENAATPEDRYLKEGGSNDPDYEDNYGDDFDDENRAGDDGLQTIPT